MSDLQIVTGLSILISGLTQLQCGLSAYHWLFIIYLAWFSTLTHLACLTMLRPYLSARSSERRWRLFAMGLQVLLLMAGTSFTGNWTWAVQDYFAEEDYFITGDRHSSFEEYAICSLHTFPSNQLSFTSMVFSELLIALSFLVRVVKLSRSLSVGVFGRVRLLLGLYARKFLRKMYNWCNTGSLQSLKRGIIFYPLLAGFLEARFFLDCWTSMLLEVCPFQHLKSISWPSWI